jgi:hypothetical protein
MIDILPLRLRSPLPLANVVVIAASQLQKHCPDNRPDKWTSTQDVNLQHISDLTTYQRASNSKQKVRGVETGSG